MAKGLQSISDEELRKELILREADRRAQENKKNANNALFVLQNVQLLLTLVPTHDTSNCSDETPKSAYLDHGHARCRRCMLLHIQEHQYNDDVGLEIDLIQLVNQTNIPDSLQVVVKDR